MLMTETKHNQEQVLKCVLLGLDAILDEKMSRFETSGHFAPYLNIPVKDAWKLLGNVKNSNSIKAAWSNFKTWVSLTQNVALSNFKILVN